MDWVFRFLFASSSCEVKYAPMSKSAARVIVGVIISGGLFFNINEDDCAEDTDGLRGGSFHNVKVTPPLS